MSVLNGAMLTGAREGRRAKGGEEFGDDLRLDTHASILPHFAGASLSARPRVGVMVLRLELFIYLWGAKSSDTGGGLDYFVDTLAFAGAALLLADALPREGGLHV